MIIITPMLQNLRKRNPIAYRDTVIILKIMSPLALVVFLGLYFHEFVWRAIEADFAISGAILSTSIYGTVIILQRLRNAQQDFRIIERFGQEAHSGVPMKELLDEPWIRDRYVRHYLKHIAETGGTLSSQLDQNAIESELHALQGDYDSKLEFPQFLVGFMIAMGLLGTFIGLLETLTGISAMLGSMGSGTASAEEQFKGLVNELRKPLAGMGIAFSASMFGLIASLMLSIMMTNLRHFISRVVMCARNVMHDLTEITRKSHPNQTGHSAGESENKETHSRHSDDAGFGLSTRNSGNILLASRMDLLLKKLEIVIKSFENSIAGTTRTNELLGFGPRMKETAENTLEEIRSVASSNLEQQRIMQQIADSQSLLVNSLNSITDSQRRTQTELSGVFRMVGEKLGSIEQSTMGSGRHLSEIREGLHGMEALQSPFKSMMADIDRQSTLVEELVGEERSIKDLMVLVLDTHRRSQTEVINALRNVVERAHSIEKTNIGAGRHLYEIKEIFTNFSALYSMIETMSSGMNHHTILFEEMIAEARRIKDSTAVAIKESDAEAAVEGIDEIDLDKIDLSNVDLSEIDPDNIDINELIKRSKKDNEQ